MCCTQQFYLVSVLFYIGVYYSAESNLMSRFCRSYECQLVKLRLSSWDDDELH